MLWSDENVEGFRQAAQNPDLRLYQSPEKGDFLVVYREQCERNERIRTRAYWLNQNRSRVTRNEPPRFVSQRDSRNLGVIPVFASLPENAETNGNLYAVYGANLQTFALFSTNREVGAYTLPAYNKGRPVAEKLALTPFTLTADAAMVAGVIALLILAAQNN